MEEINIVEILKDCPNGTKLYSTVHGEVELVDIYHNLIRCKISYGSSFVSFHSDGRWVEHRGECILFPSKDQRDWSKFHRPFKDGDIVTWDDRGSLVACIYKERKNTASFNHHIALYKGGLCIVLNGEIALPDNELSFATEEEKQQLFDAIEETGYKWNSETKTLERLITPKFKIGDKIKNRIVKTNNIYTIVRIEGLKYFVNLNNEDYNYEIDFELQNDWELVINKFDITTLKPFDKVLIRQCDVECWKPALWGRRTINKNFPFITSFGATSQAIPFKNNEWLVGTADDCDDYYKTWM